jgi:arylsulfatase A-like enzyme
MAEVLSQAGYATAFYGKLHLGDIEQSYPHNQGFDEAFWAIYNQVTSLYNTQGEAANAIIGMKDELLPDNPYQLDHNFIQDEAYVFYAEGKKGEQAKEWRGGSQEPQDYKDFDIESRDRALDFIRRNAGAKKPFYVAWWPLWTSFIPDPKKTTLQRGLVAESYGRVIEPDREAPHGPAYTGISNARPETLALSKPPVELKDLPFDPLEFIKHLGELPFDAASEPGPGQ